MKDSIYLIVTALVCAMAGWAFWHYLGNDALSVLLFILFCAESADNVRLKRKLRELQKVAPPAG